MLIWTLLIDAWLLSCMPASLRGWRSLTTFLGGAFDAAPLHRPSLLLADLRLLALTASLHRALSWRRRLHLCLGGQDRVVILISWEQLCLNLGALGKHWLPNCVIIDLTKVLIGQLPIFVVVEPPKDGRNVGLAWGVSVTREEPINVSPVNFV